MNSGLINFPVSFNQERRLLSEEAARLGLSRLPPFHAVFGFTIGCEVNLRALESAFDEIIRRHTILRTAFVPSRNAATSEHQLAVKRFVQTGLFRSGVYQQLVVPSVMFRVLDREFAAVPSGEGALRRILEDELLSSFDCRHPPLFRAMTLTSESGERLLLVGIHHLIFDLWSLNLLKSELGILYSDALAHRSPSLPPLKTQFSDFTTWQQRWLHTPRAGDGISYWKRQWEIFEPAQINARDFPFAKSHISNGGFPGAENIVLDPRLASDARTFARRARITLHILFMTAFTIVLHRCTGKRSIAVWVNCANRVREGTESLIGWFVHSHIIGVDLSDDPPVSQLLQRVRGSVLGASAQQEIPLALLWLRSGRAAHFSDLFVLFDSLVEEQSMNGWQGGGGREEGSTGPLNLQRKYLPTIRADTRHGLRVNLIDAGLHLSLSAIYATEVFPSEAIAWVLNGIRIIAARIVDGGDGRVSSLTNCLGEPSRR
jgi:hypothetical protein